MVYGLELLINHRNYRYTYHKVKLAELYRLKLQ